MTNELGHSGSPADSGGSPRPAGYCYRCGSLLEQSPDWCGTCGASQTAVCRRCGAIFLKAAGRCPRCGTRRVRRRRSRNILRRLFKEKLPALVERNRTTLLYMMAGGAVGVILGIVLKALAETSGTPSSGDHPPDSLMFWIQPFISAGRTIARAVQGFFSRTWQALVYFVLMHLKATILTIVGALVGLVLGIRAERKRRKRHARRMKTGPPRAGARRDAEP